MAFKTMEEILHDLSFVLNICPPIRKANGDNEVMIIGVESGSMWLILTIAAVAVGTVGSIMSLAFKFLNNIQFYRQQEQSIRAQEIGNDHAQAVQILVSAQANMLARQYNAEQKLELDNEEVTKLTKTIGGVTSLRQPSGSPPMERSGMTGGDVAAPKGQLRDRGGKRRDIKRGGKKADSPLLFPSPCYIL